LKNTSEYEMGGFNRPFSFGECMNDNEKKQAVNQALADADLVGLIRIGAPKDEYQSEADMIFKALLHGSFSLEDTQETIYRIFCNQFSDESEEKASRIVGEFEQYTEVAIKIKSIMDSPEE
jgi:hypothetical protein